jgi:hypothetical protein
VKKKSQPAFVSDKTVAADIAMMAKEYIAEIKTRFQSKLSLCNYRRSQNAASIRNQMLVNSGFHLGVFS